MIISIPFEKMLFFSLPQKRGIWLHILFLILHSALSFRITFNFFPSKRTTKDKNNKVKVNPSIMNLINIWGDYYSNAITFEEAKSRELNTLLTYYGLADSMPEITCSTFND